MADPGVARSGRQDTGIRAAPVGEVLIRRTAAGWRVEGGRQPGGDAVDDLDTALALADLLSEGTMPGPRPPRPPEAADQLTRLRAAVRQLEHALASRVVVEQAIGVLTERWRIAPRQAFEQLRRVTRSRGLRIHELARIVVDSATDSEVRLPGELAPPVPLAGRPPPAAARRQARVEG